MNEREDGTKAAMRWSPEMSTLKEICQVVAMTMNRDNGIREKVQRQLSKYKKSNLDYNKYLAYICVKMKLNSKGSQRQVRFVRQLAGTLLKNDLKDLLLREGRSSWRYVQLSLIQGLADEIPIIRGTCSSAISKFIGMHGLRNWPGLFQELFTLFKKNQNNKWFQNGIITCIYTILYDHWKELDSVPQGSQSPLNFIVPILIKLLYHRDVSTREKALKAICLILDSGVLPNAVVMNMSNFLKAISSLAKDPSKTVKKYVLRTFSMLISHPVYIKDNFKNIVSFAVGCVLSKDDDLIEEGLEFFNYLLCSQDKLKMIPFMLPYLGKILPVVLQSSVYDEKDRNMIEVEMRMETEINNIAPKHMKQRGIQEEEEEDGVQYYEVGSEWNLRRISLVLLEKLGKAFGGKVLPIVISYLKQASNPKTQWWIKESGVVNLGCVALGCEKVFCGMNDTKNLVGFLLTFLQKEKTPMVLHITLWTLGRFGAWLQESKNLKMFEGVLKEVLLKMMFKNIHVQESACCCFAKLIEKIGLRIGDDKYMKAIITAFNWGLNNYCKKNLIFLFDTIATFVDYAEYKVKRKDFSDMVINLVFKHWDSLKDVDYVLIGILECISTFCVTFKEESKSMILLVWKKCSELVRQTYAQVNRAKQLNRPPPEKSIIAAAMNTMNNIVSAMKGGIQSLINDNFLNMTMYCLKDNNTDVKMCAFGMCGDLSRHCLSRILPKVGIIFQEGIKSIGPKRPVSLMNNIIWCFGCIGLQGSNSTVITNALGIACKRMIALINEKNLLESLEGNLGCTLSRIAIGYPGALLPSFNSFGVQLVHSFHRITEPEEKNDLFRGLYVLVKQSMEKKINKDVLGKLFYDFCVAVARYEDPRPVKAMCVKILELFKLYRGLFGDNWNKAYGQLPTQIRLRLKSVYRIQ